MPKFKITQIVQCTVLVTYVVEAPSYKDACKDVAEIDEPTCAEGMDYEIRSDDKILSTTIDSLIP